MSDEKKQKRLARLKRELDIDMRTPAKVKEYLTHDNGARPYLVEVSESPNGQDHVRVIRLTDEQIVFDSTVVHVFVCESPKNEMTLFSGGYGPKFQGNTVLLSVHGFPATYIYVQQHPVRFKSKATIVKYMSPVGNSDVPYPYAVDTDGRLYLFVEMVMVEPCKDVTRWIESGDPYQGYYKAKKFLKFYMTSPIEIS